MKNDWTDILREKMTNHEMEPIPVDWSAIDKAMEKKADARWKDRSIWHRLSAAAALLIMFGISSLLYLYHEYEGQQKKTLASKATGSQNTDNTFKKQTDNIPAKDNTTMYKSGKNNYTYNKDTASWKRYTDTENNISATRLTENRTAGNNTIENDHVDISHREDKITRKPVRPHYDTDNDKINNTPRLFAANNKSKSDNGISVMLYASENMEERTSSIGVLPVAGLFGDAPENLTQNGTIQLAGMEISPKSSTRHHKPVRITMACSYPISQRLAISGGITYSYLKSEYTSMAKNYSSCTKQNLHYLGIPLSLRYRLFSVSIFSMYASLGGMAEKLVHGTKSTETTKNTTTEQEKTSVSSHSLQWSTNASLGIEMHLYRSVSLFGEAGATHYFSSSSSPSSYYTDKPNNIQFNFGLRYDLP